MTYDMAQTKLEGFPLQCDRSILQHLNEVSAKRMISNAILANIGREVSSNVKHTLHGDTKDGYTWFGGLEYDVYGSKVAILFPWHQDFKHPETEMDRSINVYTNRELPAEAVVNLLEQIAYQYTLAAKPQLKN